MSETDANPAGSGRSSRIGPLANLPVFFKLEGKRVVLAGGSEAALWKAELLAAAGAIVDVFADTFADGFHELALAPPAGSVTLKPQRWRSEDFASAALAIGAFADEVEASSFASSARSAGVPVNVVDRPALCDFQFGAIVNRSPLIIGITTDGAAPVFGQAIRAMIESLLPQSFRHWAEAAKGLRARGDEIGETPDAKKRFWRRFTDFALRNEGCVPDEDDIVRIVGESTSHPEVQPIDIVETGLDADDLTLGKVRVLRSADDIFFDDGLADAILDFARREARRHRVEASGRNIKDLVDEVQRVAATGARVIRLMRVGAFDHVDGKQEIDALMAAGLSVRLVRTAVSHRP
jgi:uroporphyrin-III C-methyltransferase / precorrin-2 dehydrogenase / sirohydrochlorin ferrochelatase